MTTAGDEVEVEGLGVLRNRIVEDFSAGPRGVHHRLGGTDSTASQADRQHALTTMPAPRMLMILSENWTLTDGRDLTELVQWARIAEDAGFDSVMISEHIVLGPDASDKGVMANPRAYALPGNQDPLTPWPNSLMLLSAMASVTNRIRLVARQCWRRCAIRCCWPVNSARST